LIDYSNVKRIHKATHINKPDKQFVPVIIRAGQRLLHCGSKLLY